MTDQQTQIDKSTQTYEVHVPIPTEEVGAVQSVMRRISNAITAASDLGQQLADLAAKVDALKGTVDAQMAELTDLKTKNRELDEMLHEVRRQRNEARDRADALAQERNTIAHDRDNLIAERDHLNEQVNTLHQEGEALRSNKDKQIEDLRTALAKAQGEAQDHAANASVWQNRAEEAHKRATDILSVLKPEPQAQTYPYAVNG